MNICAHNNINNDIYTCFDYQDLLAIAKAYNTYYTQHKEKVDLISIDPLPSKKELWKIISKKLNKSCKKETCWIEQNFIKYIPNNLRSKIQSLTFKPKAPKTKYAWLSTQDINDILYQYQHLYYNNFIFLGALPCDIHRVSVIDFSQIKRQTPFVGVVFNTDRFTKPGKHWVCIFIDNTSKSIDYFDSLGKQPNKFIREFFRFFNDYNVHYNTTVHQKNNSNCGVYCCFFIIERLKGKTMTDINATIIPDKIMTDYRTTLFRPRTS